MFAKRILVSKPFLRKKRNKDLEKFVCYERVRNLRCVGTEVPEVSRKIRRPTNIRKLVKSCIILPL